MSGTWRTVPSNCVGIQAHAVYFGEPIWSIGLSWYTHSYDGDDLARRHQTLAAARQYVRAASRSAA